MKKINSPNLKVPQFVTDIYRDLRDRRMLIPVILLLGALVAVPMLLSSSTQAPPQPSPRSGASVDDAAAVQPAVLAEQVGIRDYRERLEEFQEGNPFRQQFKIPEIDEGGLAGASDAGADAGLGGVDAGSTDTPTGTVPDTGSTSTATGGSTSSTSSGSSTPTTDPQPVQPPEVKTVNRFYEYRIDAKVGRADRQLNLREGIREFDLLPSASAPVVAFLGVTPDDEAAFVVSADATPVDGGDGRCVPNAQNCLFMTLDAGDEQMFDYATDDTAEPDRYELKVVDVYQHRIKGNQND